VTPDILNAASRSVPWDQLSDWGEQLVGAFGFLLWIFLIFGLLYWGMQTVFAGRPKPTKQNRGKRKERPI
jgi:uncharacterized iron-regulated membrane protein